MGEKEVGTNILLFMVFMNYRLEVKNPGGHSSQPGKENAIYRLSEGLARLSKHEFPVQLNETTRVFFDRAAPRWPPTPPGRPICKRAGSS